MTSTACKLDGGQSYASPSWAGMRRRRKDGPGNWQVAYREAQEQDYRKVQRRIKADYRRHESETQPTLDGPLLLQLHCVNDPSELSSVDIRERKLTSVKSEDFRVFKNVVYIDASINFLSLGFFSTFESLRELFLPLNGICNMTFDAAEFPHLEVLDLSFNRVSSDDVGSLGRLPCLKVLHLSANQLHHLPSDLSSSNSEPTQVPKEDDALFRSLEFLMLDDNKLSSSVFSSLRNLKRLRYLNLKGNRISEIPILQPTAPLGSESRSDEDEKEALGKRVSHRESDSDTDEYLRLFFQIFQEDDWEERCREDVQPLPELQVLDLADNKITEVEELMAAAFFPMLREIDIQSNPLVTKRRGDPPLLMYLQDRLGITINQKKSADVLKPPQKVSTHPEWKVDQRVPKVSRKSRLINATLPAHSPAAKSDAASESPAGPEGSFSLLENTESIFITQAADVPPFDVPSQDEETEEKEERNNNRPEQCTDSNTLMDAKPNPDASGPMGASTALWTPPHTLNNLDVYLKPSVDSIKTPYGQKKKRHKIGLPPLKQLKLPAERTDEMMKTCRESTAVKVIPFGSALHSANVTRAEKKEAHMLLTDIKIKYNMVYEKVIEQLASLNSEDTNQDQAEPPPEPHASA